MFPSICVYFDKKIKTTNKNFSFLGCPRRPRPPLRARQVSGLPVGGGIPVPGRDRAQVQEEAKHLRRGRPGEYSFSTIPYIF